MADKLAGNLVAEDLGKTISAKSRDGSVLGTLVFVNHHHHVTTINVGTGSLDVDHDVLVTLD